MTDPTSESNNISQGWDTYWRGAHDSAAFASGGTSHPAVLSFWSEYFSGLQDGDASHSVIDIASGNGAIVECAKSAFDGRLPEFTCVDISASAIAMLQQRFPEVEGVVADAKSIPLESRHFDIVTSQFGIEYAGDGALLEAARLVTPGGQIALLLHHRGGSIYRQCAASLDAIRKLQAANFIPLCVELFEAGFATRTGASRAPYDAAGKKLGPALRTMQSIIVDHGKGVADGTIVRLYRDVEIMHDRMQHYEPSDVLEWLRGMQHEIQAYAGRMDSMCNAAIDEKTFAAYCKRLRTEGFELLRREPLLVPETGVAMAWILVAEHRSC